MKRRERRATPFVLLPKLNLCHRERGMDTFRRWCSGFCKDEGFHEGLKKGTKSHLPTTRDSLETLQKFYANLPVSNFTRYVPCIQIQIFILYVNIINFVRMKRLYRTPHSFESHFYIELFNKGKLKRACFRIPPF